jgi:acetyl-CoA carboxylase biotin carboxylase subunit
MFRKVLVANRGEIAVRVMRTLREMGITPVAVYSEADRRALHVRYADEAVCLGPPPARESYLDIEKVLAAARQTGVEAIHPGYGFLSERAEFAQACADAGLTFIGPPPSAIVAMGEKTGARERMRAAGVPVVPGSDGPVRAEEAAPLAASLGYPVLVKAAAGGGGKGMRLVHRPEELASAVAGAKREAAAAFGDDRVYLEKYVLGPRHVEVQVFGDHHGHAIHLFERECSVQRRHQKIIEETPSCALTPDLRARMGEVAVRAARAVGYVGAGTVEFLVDARRSFYFLEMNTRLQVEHPITEMVTGLDLVRLQVEVAAGFPLSLRQEELSQRGHAVECRIYAEDADHGFLPSPGRVTEMRLPGGIGVRFDGGVYAGDEVSVHYDPLVGKLVTWAEGRAQSIARMRRALRELTVKGIETNIRFLDRVLANPRFLSGEYDTHLLVEESGALAPPTWREHEEVALAAAAIGTTLAERTNGAGPPQTNGAAVGGRRIPGGPSPWRLISRTRTLSRGGRG